MNKTFNILSYGESLSHWHNYPKPLHPEFISIGVNHVGQFTNDIDYLLLVDNPAHFTPRKIEAIKKTRPYNYFIVDLNWLAYLEKCKCVPLQLADERRKLSTIENGGQFTNLPFSYNSPFIAACLAIRLNAKTINLFGVDFNTDSAAGTDLELKNIEDWETLFNYCQKKDIDIFCTPESKLSKFIPLNKNL